MTSRSTALIQSNTNVIELLYHVVSSTIGTKINNIVHHYSENIKLSHERIRLKRIAKKCKDIYEILLLFICLAQTESKRQILLQVITFFKEDYPLVHTHVYAEIMETFNVTYDKSFNDYAKLWLSKLKTIWNNHPNKTPDEYKCMNDLIIMLVAYSKTVRSDVQLEILTEIFKKDYSLYEKLNKYPIHTMRILGDEDPHCVIESIVEFTTENGTKFYIDVLNQTAEIVSK